MCVFCVSVNVDVCACVCASCQSVFGGKTSPWREKQSRVFSSVMYVFVSHCLLPVLHFAHLSFPGSLFLPFLAYYYAHTYTLQLDIYLCYLCSRLVTDLIAPIYNGVWFEGASERTLDILSVPQRRRPNLLCVSADRPSDIARPGSIPAKFAPNPLFISLFFLSYTMCLIWICEFKPGQLHFKINVTSCQLLWIFFCTPSTRVCLFALYM